jgi:hypothetical protein
VLRLDVETGVGDPDSSGDEFDVEIEEFDNYGGFILTQVHLVVIFLWVLESVGTFASLLGDFYRHEFLEILFLDSAIELDVDRCFFLNEEFVSEAYRDIWLRYLTSNWCSFSELVVRLTLGTVLSFILAVQAIFWACFTGPCRGNIGLVAFTWSSTDTVIDLDGSMAFGAVLISSSRAIFTGRVTLLANFGPIRVHAIWAYFEAGGWLKFDVRRIALGAYVISVSCTHFTANMTSLASVVRQISKFSLSAISHALIIL